MALLSWLIEKTMKTINPRIPDNIETVQVVPAIDPVANLTMRERGLKDANAFYASIRLSKLFGPTFDTKEFQGIQEIVKDCSNAGWPLSWTAYALATAYHETAHTMQPIKEFGGRAYFMRMYDVSGNRPERARQYGNTKVGDGATYFGRGYVQLTWKNNYKKAGDELGINLVDNPDKALIPDIASDIMIRGMSEGWFTGKKCSTYLPIQGAATLAQFKSARRIINGNDKETLIAGYAIEFQKALVKGHWS